MASFCTLKIVSWAIFKSSFLGPCALSSWHKHWMKKLPSVRCRQALNPWNVYFFSNDEHVLLCIRFYVVRIILSNKMSINFIPELWNEGWNTMTFLVLLMQHLLVNLSQLKSKKFQFMRLTKTKLILVEFNHSVFWFITYLDIFSFDGHFCSRLHRSNLVLCKPKKEWMEIDIKNIRKYGVYGFSKFQARKFHSMVPE